MNRKGKQIICLFTLMTLMSILPSIISDHSAPSVENDGILDETTTEKLQTSQESTDFEWWNASYEFRIRVHVDFPDLTHKNVPVETKINFTEYLAELGYVGVNFNSTDLRVMEQDIEGNAVEISNQFDESADFDNETNAYGEVIWIASGEHTAGSSKDYFIYFNIGEYYLRTSDRIKSPNYDVLRVWHEEFDEDFNPSTDLISWQSNQDLEPTSVGINTTNYLKSNRSLSFYGNTWKRQNIPDLDIANNDYFMTYALFIDKANKNNQEITGPTLIGVDDDGFNSRYTYMSWWDNGGTPNNDEYNNTYDLQGIPNQEDYLSRWLYQTAHISTDLRNNNVGWTTIYQFGYAQDNDPTSIEPYISYDDISIWTKPVQKQRTTQASIEVEDIGRVSGFWQIRAVDVDGFPIPGANVTITNNSLSYLDNSTITDENGIAQFTNVTLEDIYNVSITYTPDNLGQYYPDFAIAYRENVKYSEYDLNTTINCGLWSMEFNITDWDGNNLENGYVALNDTTDTFCYGVQPIVDGRCVIRYKNDTNQYNYHVYYDFNEIKPYSLGSKDFYEYKENLQVLKSGVIQRDFSDSSQNGTVIYDPEDSSFIDTQDGSEDVYITYTNSSFEGGSAITNITVSFTDFTKNITKFDLWGAKTPKSTVSSEDLIETTTLGEYPPNYTTYYEYDVFYTIKSYVRKDNETDGDLDGYVTIDYNYRTTTNIKLNISTLYLNVTTLEENGGLQTVPFENYRAEIYNGSINVANLTVSNEPLHFTYLRFGPEDYANYTLKIKFYGKYRRLNITNFDGTEPSWTGPAVDSYYLNFTLMSSYQKDVIVDLGEAVFDTELQLAWTPSNFEKIYGEDISIGVYYNVSEDGVDQELDPDTITYQILDQDESTLTTGVLSSNVSAGRGYYEMTFSTDIVRVADDYHVRITAIKAQYDDTEITVDFDVNPVPTTAEIYINNKSAPVQLQKITDTTLDLYWGSKVNITVNYNTTSINISDAQIYLEWAYDGLYMDADNELGDGYYTFEIDTSKANYLGTYPIEITAGRHNYTTVENSFLLDIERIPTQIGGYYKIGETATNKENTTARMRIAETIYRQDAYNFTFMYVDNNGELISAADVAYFDWAQYNEDSQLQNAGQISLVENKSALGEYILDFDTEDLDVGQYIIDVNLIKENYEPRAAQIILNVILIPTTVNASYYDVDGSLNTISDTSDELEINLEIYKSDLYKFNFTYVDARTETVITDGTEFKNIIGQLNESEASPGVYVLDMDTEDFQVGTHQANFGINRTDYERRNIRITIVVKYREANYEGRADLTDQTDFKISHVRGEDDYVISIYLTDQSRGGVPLEGATVNLTIGSWGEVFPMLESSTTPGLYSFTITQKMLEDRGIAAFTAPESLTGDIKFWSEDFEEEEIDVEIDIEMVQIFAGLPLFYFLIAVGLIAFMVIGIGGYRYYTFARIPEFIKKCNATAKAIEKEKRIDPDIPITTPKSDYLISQLGEDWQYFGLEFADSLPPSLAEGKKMKSESYREPEEEEL